MPVERELMSRVVQHDAAAFDALYQRYAPTVHGRLAAIVRDPGVADDLLQEVFLRLWTRADQWSAQGTLQGWLARIATNVALNHLRSRRRHRHQPLEVPATDSEDADGRVPDWLTDASAIAPIDAAQRTERLEQLGRLVGELPTGQQQVYRLIQQEQKDIHEVAEELGIPAGTVKSRLHYALKRLARQLRETEHDEENLE